MTAGGINRIIHQLWTSGRTSAIVICPICEGGTRRRRTLSVDLRDGVWLYLCHRGSCTTKGAVPAVGDDGRLLVGWGKEFEPRPLPHFTRVLSATDPISLRLKTLIDRGNIGFSLDYGLRVLVDEPGTHAWIVENTKGEKLGHVTRTEDKVVKTWRTKDGPFYSAFVPPVTHADRFSVVVIVEDPLSGALLAEAGFRAIALHGTNLSREAAAEIAAWPGVKTFLVALDPDEAGRAASQRATDRMRAAGANTHQWLLSKDVNKMTLDERGALCNDIDRTLGEEWNTRT